MTCTDDAYSPFDEPGSAFDPSSLDTEQLAEEVCRFGAQVAASTARYVLLAAELDRREGWAVAGVRTCAHWLNWRCGLSLPAAREHLRVGHALSSLPQVRRSFLAGEISYSKVRAITRIATDATEASLIEMAGLMTASALEGVCHSYRAVEQEDARLDAAAEARAHRDVRYYTAPNGRVVIHGELAPDEGAVVIAALEAGLRALRQERADRPEPAEHHEHDDQHAGAARPLDASAETSEGSEQSADASAETFPAWPTLADALVSMAETALAHDPTGPERSESARVVLHIDQRVLDDPGHPGCCHLESVGVVPVAMAERLMCDATVRTVRYTHDGIELSSPNRTVPERLHRALRLRDGGCRFPGCGVTRHLHAHHVQWVSMGGPTVMSNLCYLCSYHHHLVHEGGFSISLTPGGDVTVLDPDGAQLRDIVPRVPAAGDVPRAGPMPSGGEAFRRIDVIDALWYLDHPPGPSAA